MKKSSFLLVEMPFSDGNDIDTSKSSAYECPGSKLTCIPIIKEINGIKRINARSTNFKTPVGRAIQGLIKIVIVNK